MEYSRVKSTCITKWTVFLKDFASFAIRPFFTLTTIFGHLDGVGSHKNTGYE